MTTNDLIKHSDSQLRRLYDWLRTENRSPAQTHFTAGWLRNVAREIEFQLHEEKNKS